MMNNLGQTAACLPLVATEALPVTHGAVCPGFFFGFSRRQGLDLHTSTKTGGSTFPSSRSLSLRLFSDCRMPQTARSGERASRPGRAIFRSVLRRGARCNQATSGSPFFSVLTSRANAAAA